MSVLQKIIILVLNLFRVNGEVNYLSLTIVAGLIPMLIWFSIKLLTKKGPNPFARDTRRHSELLETDLKVRDKVLKNGFVAKKVPDNLDAIVIGSGIGSLSCAAILAKAGKKVLVLEQHDQAGGCCHTFYEKGSFCRSGDIIVKFYYGIVNSCMQKFMNHRQSGVSCNWVIIF